MKKILFLCFTLIFILSCKWKVESGKVVKIIYPSDKIEVAENFYVLVASLTWNDTFIFNPFLFGKVNTIDTKGSAGSLFIDGKLFKTVNTAKHHIFRLSLPEGNHSITFKTKFGKDSVNIKVTRKAKFFEPYTGNLSMLLNKVGKITGKIDSNGFKAVKVVINKEKALVVWKKTVGYSSLLRFDVIDINGGKSGNKKVLKLPDDLIYGNSGEFFLSGVDKGAVVSCGDGFLFRILKDEKVILYKVNNDNSIYTTTINLYDYADKNDKLMTPAYKYPNYYHISCDTNIVALAYPVYGDYNLDYKVVINEKNSKTESYRITDFDNFKFQFFITKDKSIFIHKIPEKVYTTEKHRLFLAKNRKIREITFPFPFQQDYIPINQAYVNIKGKYYPPKIYLEPFNIGQVIVRIKIFGKTGSFKVKRL